jgi:hypothetical protein
MLFFFGLPSTSYLTGDPCLNGLIFSDLKLREGILCCLVSVGTGILSLGGTSMILVTFLIYFSIFSAT